MPVAKGTRRAAIESETPPPSLWLSLMMEVTYLPVGAAMVGYREDNGTQLDKGRYTRPSETQKNDDRSWDQNID
jgi:hypothetical protein